MPQVWVGAALPLLFRWLLHGKPDGPPGLSRYAQAFLLATLDAVPIHPVAPRPRVDPRP
jgi:hypothetical protein